MKKIILLLFALPVLYCVAAQDTTSISQTGEIVTLQNAHVQLSFNIKDGYYSINKAHGDTIIQKAYFQAGGLQSKDKCESRKWRMESCHDALGNGKVLSIRIVFEGYADITWNATLYDDKPYLVFSMGIVNDVSTAYRLMSFSPLISKSVYKGKDNSLHYAVLDGNSGGSPTRITDTSYMRCFNNALVKFGPATAPNILVAGGITYHEFEKFIKVSREKNALQLSIYSEDPVGKLIDAGQTYQPEEKFYLCFINDDPFQALEQYADVLKAAQKINLDYYDFPTECLWYAAFYNIDSTREKFNNTKGAVEEMENAIKSGITKYSKVAIRLVPDAYGANNQQGWWDDKHWVMYNQDMSTKLPHYTAPYTTTQSWCKAIIDKGGYPFTYMQSARRSEDFVKLHPGWMLFNDPYRPYTGIQRLTQEATYPNQFSEGYSRHWWSDNQLWGYDFTDTGFIMHMKEVYANLKSAGVKGIFYDYPEPTAWAYEGGFEDKHATTAWAYRQMFQIAKDVMGSDVLLQERNVIRGSDIALGAIASQRVWGDTDGIEPEMVSLCGLRWYKNRKVINYDMDSKDPSDALPLTHNDGNRSMLSMCYFTSGRFLLGRSFSQLSAAQLYDLSRTFPYHATSLSARPIDAFDAGIKYPRIYDFPISNSWHQLAFYNYDSTEQLISVVPGKSLNEGGLGLNFSKQYYVYDFWNDTFAGLLNGGQLLRQQVRAGETRVMSVHEKQAYPQFIATNRHILQGYLDLRDVEWMSNKKTLRGVSQKIVSGEMCKMVIACNGYEPVKCKTSTGMCTLVKQSNGLAVLQIKTSDHAENVKWEILFK